MSLTLGQRIKCAIAESGADYRAVAQRCGVSVQAVYAWTRDEVGNVRAENLFPLADITGFEARWIALGEGPKISRYRNTHIERVLAVMEPMSEDVQIEAQAQVERVAAFANKMGKS